MRGHGLTTLEWANDSKFYIKMQPRRPAVIDWSRGPDLQPPIKVNVGASEKKQPRTFLALQAQKMRGRVVLGRDGLLRQQHPVQQPQEICGLHLGTTVRAEVEQLLAECVGSLGLTEVVPQAGGRADRYDGRSPRYGRQVAAKRADVVLEADLRPIGHPLHFGEALDHAIGHLAEERQDQRVGCSHDRRNPGRGLCPAAQEEQVVVLALAGDAVPQRIPLVTADYGQLILFAHFVAFTRVVARFGGALRGRNAYIS